MPERLKKTRVILDLDETVQTLKYELSVFPHHLSHLTTGTKMATPIPTRCYNSNINLILQQNGLNFSQGLGRLVYQVRRPQYFIGSAVVFNAGEVAFHGEAISVVHLPVPSSVKVTGQHHSANGR